MTLYIRIALYAAVVASVGGGLWGLHRHGVNTGRADIQAQWDAAKAEAQATQDAQTETAAATLTEEVEAIRTVYKDRTKEVIRYVPTTPHCPSDPDFIRLFNAAR